MSSSGCSALTTYFIPMTTGLINGPIRRGSSNKTHHLMMDGATNFINVMCVCTYELKSK